MKKPPETENHVKDIVRQWYDAHDAYHYAITQQAFGTHGLPDRVGCLPVTVTPQMVGKRIGLFVAVESKRPGRRGEPRRGMKQNQEDHMLGTIKAGGLSICCDGQEDLNWLDASLGVLKHG